jgi:Peptidase propeptide and YPEB domain
MKTSLRLIIIAATGVVALGGLATGSIPSASARGIFSAHKQQAAPEASDGDQESARLQTLATITPQQAQQTAEQQMGKPADKVEIENDDGSLVYAVSFGQQDVKVDAGNGQVLYTDNSQDEDHEMTHPKSSIQLSGTDVGDGDGETNDDG